MSLPSHTVPTSFFGIMNPDNSLPNRLYYAEVESLDGKESSVRYGRLIFQVTFRRLDTHWRKKFLQGRKKYFSNCRDPSTGENFNLSMEEVAAYMGVEMPQ